MAEQQYTEEELQVIRDTANRLPGQWKPLVENVVIPRQSPPPKTTAIDVNDVINWIAWVDKPDSVPHVVHYWEVLGRRCQEIGYKPNRFALTKLPEPTGNPSWNGAIFDTWIKAATKADADVIDKLYAAMRLRVRAANWYVKRKR